MLCFFASYYQVIFCSEHGDKDMISNEETYEDAGYAIGNDPGDVAHMH
jgi:hypothetical protein